MSHCKVQVRHFIQKTVKKCQLKNVGKRSEYCKKHEKRTQRKMKKKAKPVGTQLINKTGIK